VDGILCLGPVRVPDRHGRTDGVLSYPNVPPSIWARDGERP
jgi:hypothetical protein